MSTAPIIYGGTGAASNRRREPAPEDNPRARRFLINPGVRALELHPRESGLQQPVIPYGMPFRVENFDGMQVRNWSVDPDDNSPPETTADVTAKEFADNILRAARQGSRDMGTRELRALTTLTDEEATRILGAILPQLPSVACPYAEENTEDVVFERIVGERAEVRTVTIFRCVTCSLAWLTSAECKAAAEALPHGREARSQTLDAFKANRQFFATLWAEWDADMKKRQNKEPGISVLDDGHKHVMRQLHEVEPEMRQAEAIRESNMASADAMKEGFREVAREMADAVRPPAAPPAPAFNYDDLKRHC
jgi:hypothetical protein